MLGVSSAVAEPPQPMIGLVYPAGGQRGKAVEATVTGTNLQAANGFRVSGGGVLGKVVKVENPSTVRVWMAIEPDAEPGQRDFRLITPGGVSNRFRFTIGELAEVNEVEPNHELDKAQLLDSLPKVINGQITAEDRDYYKFTAKAGQTLVCALEGRKLLPYLPDAVPGWLDACLTLYDPGGKRLAFVNDFRFDPDPVLIYQIPKDGEYTLLVADVLNRGRPEFVYRLTIGTVPFLTHVFPLGGQRNTTVLLELHGANLPGPSLSRAIPGDAPGLGSIVVQNGAFSSNTLPFAASAIKDMRATKPNHTLAQAARVEVPAAINGRLPRPGESDYFIFAAKPGQALAMEVQARRLGSPLDSVIGLYNARGDLLAENDDSVDPDDALVLHHADSRMIYGIPAAGDYVLRIRDAQGKGGEDYAYRLLVAPVAPDYSLRVTPDNPRLTRGDTAMVTVNAIRKDGFGSEIAFAVQGLPAGFVASDGVIPAGQDQAKLTITAPADASQAVVAPSIVGTATLGKDVLTRTALAAESVMQAFSITHSVPTKEFVVAVVDPVGFTLSLKLPPKEVLQVKQGGTVEVGVKATRKEGAKDPITLAAVDAPAGITLKTPPIPAGKDEAVISIAVPKAAPAGLRVNVIVNGTTTVVKESVTRLAPAISLRIFPAK
jgi:hypothetical protein